MPTRQTNRPAPTALTTRELCAATGASARQIRYWLRTGLIDPSDPIWLIRLRLALVKRFGTNAEVAERVLLACAIRRRRPSAPFFVVTDSLGKNLQITRSKRRVFSIAKNATRGVVVVEVEA
jgi:hypothetical protein